ncbi:MAG TPA: hypothetical protein VF713_04840, partial [Thermoanaerobaculia bacterium]
IEAVCEYLRKEVAEPALHEHTDRFIKYIWSVFFFVLTVNILGLLVVAGSVAINFLELFVAFLQAFIFTFLTTLFIGMSVVFHHDDHHAEQHEGHEAAAH